MYRLANLSDIDVLERINRAAHLPNIISDGIGNEFGDHFLEFAAVNLPIHDLHHLAADGLHLPVLGVASFLLLVCHLLSETNAEDTEEVAVSSLHVSRGTNVSLQINITLLDQKYLALNSIFSFTSLLCIIIFQKFYHLWLQPHLPLFDHAPEFVCGEVHAMEVGENALTNHILGNELELAETSLGISFVLQIGKRDLKDTVLQTFAGNF